MKNKQEGFTLIELIIVIAILAIIAVIAVPNILGAVENSRRAADVANAKVILNAAAQVQAREAGLTQIDGTYIIDDDIDGEAGAEANAGDFGDALEVALNNTVPEPRLQGNSFVLIISDNTMSVQTNDGDVVAPNPSGEYDQE